MFGYLFNIDWHERSCFCYRWQIKKKLGMEKKLKIGMIFTILQHNSERIAKAVIITLLSIFSVGASVKWRPVYILCA